MPFIVLDWSSNFRMTVVVKNDRIPKKGFSLLTKNFLHLLTNIFLCYYTFIKNLILRKEYEFN